MPEYLYVDLSGHEESVVHRMMYSTGVTCSVCGDDMWRKPQPVNVTWGGLAPSQGNLNPEVQSLLDSAGERREQFDAKHENHERRTERENKDG